MLDDLQQRELSELIDARWEGTLTERQAARLRHWTCRDDDACRFYLDHMALHGLLVLAHVENAPAEALATVTADASHEGSGISTDAGKSDNHILGFLGDGIQAGVNFFTQPFLLTMVLTLGLPSVLFLILLVHIKSQPVPESPVVGQRSAQVAVEVATVARMHKCVWEDPGKAVAPGTMLPSGRRLRLREGLVELFFADGAKVLLEGPVTFDATHCNGGFLRAGRLVASVPKSAVGFTVQTPAANVVDLGTVFGVSVAADGTAEAHVFQGEVVATTRPTRQSPTQITRQIRAGQAVRIHRAVNRKAEQVELITARDRDFVQQIPAGKHDENTAAPDKAANRLIASVNRSNGVRSDKNPYDYCIGQFDGNTEPLPSEPSGLRKALRLYSDRPYLIEKVDKGLVGADYTRTYLHDKFGRERNCTYEVTLTTDHDNVFLIVLIDDRFGKKKPGDLQRAVDKVVSKFAKPGTFVDTGLDVVFSNPEKERHSMSAFGKMVPTKDRFGKPIKYSLGDVPTRKIGFYSIAVMKKAPELKKEDGAAAGKSAGKSIPRKTKRPEE